MKCVSVISVFLFLGLSSLGLAENAETAIEIKEEFSFPELIKWKPRQSGDPLEEGRPKTSFFPCAERGIYPTHPGQGGKVYHLDEVGTYPAHKLPNDHLFCKVKNKGKGKFCIAAGNPGRVKMSDFFMDRCRNFYRAVWERKYVAFRTKADHEFTTSIGRPTRLVPMGAYSESEDESTVEVSNELKRHLLFLNAATPAEITEIKAKQRNAQESGAFYFDESSLLFIRVKK